MIESVCSAFGLKKEVQGIDADYRWLGNIRKAGLQRARRSVRRRPRPPTLLLCAERYPPGNQKAYLESRPGSSSQAFRRGSPCHEEGVLELLGAFESVRCGGGSSGGNVGRCRECETWSRGGEVGDRSLVRGGRTAGDFHALPFLRASSNAAHYVRRLLPPVPLDPSLQPAATVCIPRVSLQNRRSCADISSSSYLTGRTLRRLAAARTSSTR